MSYGGACEREPCARTATSVCMRDSLCARGNFCVYVATSVCTRQLLCACGNICSSNQSHNAAALANPCSSHHPLARACNAAPRPPPVSSSRAHWYPPSAVHTPMATKQGCRRPPPPPLTARLLFPLASSCITVA